MIIAWNLLCRSVNFMKHESFKLYSLRMLQSRTISFCLFCECVIWHSISSYHLPIIDYFVGILWNGAALFNHITIRRIPSIYRSIDFSPTISFPFSAFNSHWSLFRKKLPDLISTNAFPHIKANVTFLIPVETQKKTSATYLRKKNPGKLISSFRQIAPSWSI